MKKLFQVGAAAVLSALLLAGAAGCATADKAARMRSEAISQLSWDQCFSQALDYEGVFSNFRIDLQLTYTQEEYVSGIYRTVCTEYVAEAVVADRREYVRVEGKQTGKYGDISLDETVPVEESYLECKTDGTYTRYTRDAAGGLHAEQSDASESVLTLVGRLRGIAGSIVYEDFLFDDDRKGYALKDDVNGEGPVLKFDKEGRLSGVWMEYDHPDDVSGRSSLRFGVVFTYGGQSVSIWA